MKKVIIGTKSSNRNSRILSILVMILCLIILTSCAKKEEETPLDISQEIKEFIYFQGEESASSVLLYSQGGPGFELSEEEVKLFFQGFNSTDILMANVHQAQTLQPNAFADNDISLNEAINFNAESVENLAKVITFFKNQNRTVYVLGVSYGAFIVQELIAKKGINIADNYLIMTGRLDLNDAIWQGASEGKNGFFQNGITPVVNANPETDVIERNSNRMFAGVGMNRYTERLNTIDDLSKITYVYGTQDNAVGSLTAEEVQFLQLKNATIIAGNGNHDETFNDFIVIGLKEAFGIVPK